MSNVVSIDDLYEYLKTQFPSRVPIDSNVTIAQINTIQGQQIVIETIARLIEEADPYVRR